MSFGEREGRKGGSKEKRKEAKRKGGEGRKEEMRSVHVLSKEEDRGERAML